MIKKILPPIAFFLFVFYLVMNRLWISDEFAWMSLTKAVRFEDLLFPRDWFLIAPVEHYLLYIWCRFFDISGVFAVALLKASYICLSFYFIRKFFGIFLNKQDSSIASFLFIFFPSHDATAFSYIGLYCVLTIAFYLYSFYLAYNNKLISAFIMASFASFTSYASVPMAFSLFILFALHKEFKKGLIVFLPNLLYSIYYIFMVRIMHITESQIPDSVNLYNIVKQFILQIITFIDSMAGPSMWLKIYYSFYQLSFLSIGIGLIFIIAIFRLYKQSRDRYNKKLIICLSAIALSSFVLFAVTGMYPQLAFNFGNRATIYGSLLISYLIVLIPLSPRLKILVFVILFFTILGISDHWKKWGLHQGNIIANIANNEGLKNYSDNKIIYISGNQYTKYGPISHIEIFSEDWSARCLFKLLFNKEFQARSLNKRHLFENGYLIDTKYGTKTKEYDYINVYDSEQDKLLKISAQELNNYISSLPFDYRHWVQLFNIKPLKDISIKLMPRLRYAL